MKKIIIELEVKNPEEVMKREKGKFQSAVASALLSKGAIKKKVEEKVCEEFIKAVKKDAKEEFKVKGIDAKMKISLQ